jgi:hypothetical protein
MRTFMMLPTLVAITAGSARAEPARPAEPGPARLVAAVAVNVLPVAPDTMLAGTVWVRLDAHQAIRANVARYRSSLLGSIATVFSDRDGPEEGDLPLDFGATTDVSLGWSYYPRRVLDGPSIETELLTRFDRRRDGINGQNMADDEHHTNVYGGRVLASWTWRLSDHWFLATGIGGALGYERGREKTFVGYSSTGDVTRSGPVSRGYASLETYMRIGLGFGP